MDPTAKARQPGTAPFVTWNTAAEALLTTGDGTRVHAVYRPADTRANARANARTGARLDGGPAAAADTAVVVAHGFTGSVERPAVRRAVEVLSRHAGVVSFSFRGHGRSGGRSTVGDREVLDVEAAVAWARSLGHRRIATIGFSMGGAVVVRHAALYGGVDAVAAVSAPARWYYRGTVPMRRLHWVVLRPLGRAVARYGLGTRIDAAGWGGSPVRGARLQGEGPLSPEGGEEGRPAMPVPPTEAAGRLGRTPLLVVHGDRDPYFPLDHPRALYAATLAAGGEAELWIEPGFGHAENEADERLLARIGDWLAARAAAGPVALP
jgi:pimeloyl-ACP methyl ester carboxylesterase